MRITRGITISPRPHDVNTTLLQHFDDIQRWIIRTLNRSCGYYILYPEITETGRLHFHGVITVTNEVKWKKETIQWLNKIGFIKLENFYKNGFTGKLRWMCYCRKEFHQTQQVLDIKQPIVHQKIPKKKIFKPAPDLDVNLFAQWKR